MLWLLVTASVVPSSPILVTLMKEALGSSEVSVLTRATWRNIPEDTILHSDHCKNLKSYMMLIIDSFLPVRHHPKDGSNLTKWSFSKLMEQ
jgi:hypothetical protein